MAGTGRVCLFTGISGSLGTDFASRFADAYELVGVYNTRLPSVPFVGLEAAGPREPGNIVGMVADLSIEGAVEELVERVLARFGSIDLLVNAAVYRRFGRLKHRAFVDSLARQFYVNASVPVKLAAALTRRTWQYTPEDNYERGRNVVNLSSIAGHAVYPGGGQSGYGATKAALDLFTRHLAGELAEIGVRANALAPNTFPGWVPTQSVSDAIRRYDQSNRTGDVLVLDADGERLLADGHVLNSRRAVS